MPALLRRRSFLGFVGTAAASACAFDEPVRSPQLQPRSPYTPFLDGIASGDPRTESVILWTRLDLEAAHGHAPSGDAPEPIVVHWEVALDSAFSRIVAEGEAIAQDDAAHTVKVDVTGLQPGTHYHYRFHALGHPSPHGRTRTLPVGEVSSLRLAVVSCANLPVGYFNAYEAIALRDDIDVVVHLGDYIYEYADETLGDPTLQRFSDPHDREIVTLDEYRRRHASYKRDPQLQAMHARHPMIAIWDDHEIANNAWREGAQNHQPEEGEFADRRAAAVRAWCEWMPVRVAADPSQIHRCFRFGDLLELIMLDARLVGRDRQVSRDDGAALESPERTLLGPTQERWLLDCLRRAAQDGVAWRAIGQQVLMTHVRDSHGRPRNMDMWDGYPAARERLLAAIDEASIRDVLVLTGDIHSSWAATVHRDPFGPWPTPPLAVELTAPAVSSPPPKDPPLVSELLTHNPHLRWVDLTQRGYLLLHLEPRQAVATWHHTADVARAHHDLPAAMAFIVPRGSAELIRAPGPDAATQLG
jgi:alkaline phosphatase D